MIKLLFYALALIIAPLEQLVLSIWTLMLYTLGPVAKLITLIPQAFYELTLVILLILAGIHVANHQMNAYEQDKRLDNTETRQQYSYNMTMLRYMAEADAYSDELIYLKESAIRYNLDLPFLTEKRSVKTAKEFNHVNF